MEDEKAVTGQCWNGPVHWGSRVIKAGPVTTNPEIRAGADRPALLPVDQAACSDKSVRSQHTESPTKPDLHQEECRKMSPHADLDILRESGRS
jgi:hypothetical protein